MSDSEPDNKSRAQQLEEANQALEARILEMEKNLKEARESRANATHVESALKDMQDKLRRDRREQELETARQTAEAKTKDLERRLVEEREMWVNLLKEQALKSPDTQPLRTEIAALRESIAQKETAFAAAREEVKALQRTSTGQDQNLERRMEELVKRVHALQQSLVEKDAEKEELLGRLKASETESALPKEKESAAGPSPAAAELERDRSVLQKRIKEQADYALKLKARAADLEREVAERDKKLAALREESQDLQKRVVLLTSSKDAETRLLRENMQRLGKQNQQLLAKLQELAGLSDEDDTASPVPGAPGVHEMLGSLESALNGRDRMLADQQKSLEEKRGLIEGLFGDLKSLDEQAVSLLEEKNQKINALIAENEALRKKLEGR